VRHDPDLLKTLLENCVVVDGIVHIAFINDGGTERRFNLSR